MSRVDTPYFAVPASTALADGVARLSTTTDRRQRVELFRSVASLFVDSVVEGLVLGLLREGGALGTTTGSLLESLAGLIKGVAHGLIRGALSNPSDDELAKLEGYLRAHVRAVAWDRPEPHAVVFPLDEAVSARLRARFAASHAGRATEERGEYGESLIAFIDEGLEAYLVEPFALLPLGRLMRAAVDVGHSTITRASHAAARHSAQHDDEAALASLTRFLETRFVAVVA